MRNALPATEKAEEGVAGKVGIGGEILNATHACLETREIKQKKKEKKRLLQSKVEKWR